MINILDFFKNVGSFASDLWGSVWPYLIAVLLFLVLILIHEFGHFIAAKLLGVRVNEFAVGFGPKLFAKQFGETKYALNLIPLGGYCAMEGEDEDSTDNRAFCNKAAWRRFLIVVMGAVFNLVFGFIIVSIILAPNEYFLTTTVDEFKNNAVSVQSGLEENDRIVKVDGRTIFSAYDLNYAFTNVKDGEIDITVVRDGKKKELNSVKFETTQQDGIELLTVDFYVKVEPKNLLTYAKYTVKTSASYCAVIWRSLVDLLSGKYGISAISGPVGVTVVIADAAKQSLQNILPLLAFISINLGIFNLLPVPALDGGRLLFIVFEMVTRKRVPQKYESIIHTAGFILLIGFMIFILVKDVLGLIN